MDKLRYEPLEELPWGDNGAYLSTTALNDGDRAALKDLLSHAVRTGAVWKAFQRSYPAEARPAASGRPETPSRHGIWA